MAKKQEKEGESTKKVFNFGDSPLMKKTEQNVVKGGVGKPAETAAPVQQVEQPAANAAAATEPEETKGIQAYIPMSLYERLVMRKLKTKEPLGSMFQQAMQLWIDVQEGKLTVQKV